MVLKYQNIAKSCVKKGKENDRAVIDRKRLKGIRKRGMRIIYTLVPYEMSCLMRLKLAMMSVILFAHRCQILPSHLKEESLEGLILSSAASL